MDEAVGKRIPPNNQEAEQAVIGAMLMDEGVILEISTKLTKDDFYYPQYGLLYQAMVELSNERKPVDVLTVSNKLQEMGAPEFISSTTVRDILATVPTIPHPEEYAAIVKNMATLRKVINFSETTMELCYAANTDVKELLDDVEKDFLDVMQRRNRGKGYTLVKDIIPDVLDTIEASSKKVGNVTGIRTGFIDLDEKLTGLHEDQLIVIAARPGMGKTAFALNIAMNVAMNEKLPCAVFSLEMGEESLVTRLIATDSMVDSQKIRTGQLEDSDWEKVMDSTARVADLPIAIVDTPRITVQEIQSQCRRIQQEQGGLGLVVVDYLQLMGESGSGRNESRQQVVSENSRSLKILAKELKVPVIALSQLNRAIDSREDHKPVLSDLRESGAIEQDADVIMFIYRDEVYNSETTKPGIADIKVAKQRNGSTGTIELVWLGQFTKFANKEREKWH